MRAVVQRVSYASVSIDGNTVGEIGNGVLVYLGITESDTEADMTYIAEKIINLRIFEDENGVPNLSLADINGECLLISQFTLYGDARKGRRPSYIAAAPASLAKPLYDKTISYLRERIPVETGVFQTDMAVSSVNDGPFTILLDSGRAF